MDAVESGAEILGRSDGMPLRSIDLHQSAQAVTGGADRLIGPAQADRIDGRGGADAGRAGNRAFDVIGSTAFGGAAGELRAIRVGDDTLVMADTNGDRRADLWLIAGDATLREDHFLLQGWSEQRDSNPRPSGPKPDALPGCAMLRHGRS